MFAGTQIPVTPTSHCCPSGFFPVERRCDACPEGKYQEEEVYLGKCWDCPEGKWSDSNAARTCNSTCGAGTYSNEKGLASQSQCKDCPRGRWSDSTNLISEDECHPCPAGKFGIVKHGTSEAGACRDCAAGKYEEFDGEKVCYGSCPPGKYVNSTVTGARSEQELCADCPPGSYCLTGVLVTPCPAGMYGSPSNSTSVNDCQHCPKGRYNDKRGQINLASCKFCDDGKSTISTKTEGRDGCVVEEFLCSVKNPSERPVASQGQLGSICQKCPAGYHGDGDGRSCIMCPKGKYQDEMGEIECKKCTSAICSVLYGVTTNTLGFTDLAVRTLPTGFMNNSYSAVNTTSTPNTEKDELSKTMGMRQDVKYTIYYLLAAIGFMTVALHRYFPLGFRRADLLFAGDHYISDTVRSFHNAGTLCNPMSDR